MAENYKDDIREIHRGLGKGDPYTAMQNLFYGINQKATGTSVPGNSDHYGLTFFTRPRLNLSYHNVLAERRMHSILTQDKYSMAKAIRCMLDPEGNNGRYGTTYETPLIDPKQAFMPMFQDLLLSISGFPDVMVDSFTADPGYMKETYGFIDTHLKEYQEFDLTATFKNIAGDPVTMALNVWLNYARNVLYGSMVPYPDSIYYNEVDYNTRIYRLTLDPSRRIVQKICCTGASYPTTDPIGSSFNFNVESPTNTDNNQLSVQFRSFGVLYNDPMVVHSFNKIVCVFNGNMLPSDPSDPTSPPRGQVNGTYKKVTTNLERNKSMYKAYPRINIATMELEWYCPVEFLQ